MKFLERKYDWSGTAITEAYDELPLWSAAPGSLLLEELPYAGVVDALDVACGTGFPLLQLARRLGPGATLTGIDQWEAALRRTQHKIDAWGMQNVHLVLGDAHSLPFPDAGFDLVTSNLGINNFSDVPKVLAECHRVLRPAGRLCMATNLHGTFAEFYDAFAKAVSEIAGLSEKVRKLEAHRPTLEGLVAQLAAQRLELVGSLSLTSTVTYADGTAFLHDGFIGMGFLPAWIDIVPDALLTQVFQQVEVELNALAAKSGRLRLSVPIAYLELRPA